MTQKRYSIIARSPKMASLMDTLPLLAAMDVSVLLTGASGTGKGLMAQELIAHSQRAACPVVVINCAALSEQRVAEQLFGEYRDGEFTPGYLHAAQQGTLVLDEVAELSLKAQGALLRFMDSGEVQPVGSDRPIFLDVRIIAASNADMLERVQLGGVREDFYHRLNGVPLLLPSLCERKEDLPELLALFAQQQAQTTGREPLRFSAAALKGLRQYSWPGNVRELRNMCVRLAALLPTGSVVDAGNLPQEIREERQRGQLGAMDLVAKEVDLIKQALADASGNKSKAARLLGISRDTLNYRLRKYELV